MWYKVAALEAVACGNVWEYVSGITYRKRHRRLLRMGGIPS